MWIVFALNRRTTEYKLIGIHAMQGDGGGNGVV